MSTSIFLVRIYSSRKSELQHIDGTLATVQTLHKFIQSHISLAPKKTEIVRLLKCIRVWMDYNFARAFHYLNILSSKITEITALECFIIEIIVQCHYAERNVELTDWQQRKKIHNDFITSKKIFEYLNSDITNSCQNNPDGEIATGIGYWSAMKLLLLWKNSYTHVRKENHLFWLWF